MIDAELRGVAAGARSIECDARAIDNDVRGAFVIAGFKASEAGDAVRRARLHVGEDAVLEQMLRAALRYCATEREVRAPSRS